jgi:hypothetical protein
VTTAEERSVEAFDAAVFRSLLEGFQARAGMKERFQALSEYEVARRMGAVDCSYVEYDDHPEREKVRSALTRLQRQGRVRAASVVGRYETFVPAEVPEPAPTPEPAPVPPKAGGSSEAAAGPLPTTFEGRLDEIIRLLRSIDAHLGRIERG